MKQSNNITLDHGGGGYKSWELLQEVRKILSKDVKELGNWQNTEDDAATYDLGDKKLVFTSDAFIVDPIFFPGGDIGKIAMSGTINDLSVMGAKPIGISLSIVMEEGFSKEDLLSIIGSINEASGQSGVPVVTGDTKVTEKGKIDKIEITTSGVGLADNIISNSGAQAGDVIVTSGDLGEHAVALLSKRFNYETDIVSDSKPFNKEIEKVSKYLKACKDPTRGGLAANLVEIAEKSKVKIILDEQNLPYKKETIAISELLGIDIFSLASEGRFVAAVSSEDADEVIRILKEFDENANIIGKVEDVNESEKTGLYLKTKLGGIRPIEMPKGKLIPRIC